MTDRGDPAGALPEPTTPDGREGLEQLLRSPESALLAFDFDGTLAPIVDDPEQAYAHPDAAAALALVAPSVGQLAIVTGRPARVAVRLGGFGDVAGLENLIVLGQYGLERWDAASGRFWSADQPEGLGAGEAIEKPAKAGPHQHSPNHFTEEAVPLRHGPLSVAALSSGLRRFGRCETFVEALGRFVARLVVSRHVREAFRPPRQRRHGGGFRSRGTYRRGCGASRLRRSPISRCFREKNT